MNAWEENIHLIRECDLAVEPCDFCGRYGHAQHECTIAKTLKALQPKEPEPSLGRAVWAVFISGAIFWILFIWKVTR